MPFFSQNVCSASPYMPRRHHWSDVWYLTFASQRHKWPHQACSWRCQLQCNENNAYICVCFVVNRRIEPPTETFTRHSRSIILIGHFNAVWGEESIAHDRLPCLSHRLLTPSPWLTLCLTSLKVNHCLRLKIRSFQNRWQLKLALVIIHQPS